MVKNRRDHLEESRRYRDAVRRILLKEWDPIGVKDVPEAQDEYDCYVPGICGLLMRRESPEEIFRHLWEIETGNMGLQGNREHTRSIASRLVAIIAKSQDRDP